jgi:hypothetical protein
MPGQGKYTNYSDKIPGPDQGGTSAGKLTFLSKLFPGGPKLDIKTVIDAAKKFLTPAVQDTPDLSFPGQKVNLNFADAPSLSDVKFKNPGDPSTPFTPDVRSPGSAVAADQLGDTSTDSIQTNLIPVAGDPGVNVNDFAPNYVPGGPGTGTKSPSATSTQVSSKVLGENLPASTGIDGSGGEIYK